MCAFSRNLVSDDAAALWMLDVKSSRWYIRYFRWQDCVSVAAVVAALDDRVIPYTQHFHSLHLGPSATYKNVLNHMHPLKISIASRRMLTSHPRYLPFAYMTRHPDFFFGKILPCGEIGFGTYL
jgi:hypothetical protein